MVIIPRRLGFMRKWPSAAGVWNEQRLRLPRAFSFVYSFMSFSIYIYQRLLHHSRCVCHQQRRVTLPWALRLCLRGKVGGKTRITPFDFILVDFPYFWRSKVFKYFWRSRGGFRKKNFCSILLLLIPFLLKEVKPRLVCRVSQRSGQQKENIHQNWLLWGQIFPWAWLGSAGSSFANSKKWLKINFQTQGTLYF